MSHATTLDPSTEAGKALYNLVREPLIYGVSDRLDLKVGHKAAWAIRDGIIAIEAEAREAGQSVVLTEDRAVAARLRAWLDELGPLIDEAQHEAYDQGRSDQRKIDADTTSWHDGYKAGLAAGGDPS